MSPFDLNEYWDPGCIHTSVALIILPQESLTLYQVYDTREEAIIWSSPLTHVTLQYISCLVFAI